MVMTTVGDLASEATCIGVVYWQTIDTVVGIYKALRIILGGGKVPEIMEAIGFSEAEAEEIYREEVEMQ